MQKSHSIKFLRKLVVCLFALNSWMGISQNSMTGDGFGGRLWYKPNNYTVGSYSAYTVCGDSQQLFGWGDNLYGQLGNGTTWSVTQPIKVKGMTHVKFYSTGYLMGAIKTDKTGWVWGIDSINPQHVINDVKFLDAGSSIVSFVKEDSTVWSVGRNTYGSFGNDSIEASTTYEAKKMIGIQNAVRVSNSNTSTLVLLADSTLMTCGTNVNGVLGIDKSKYPKAIRALPIPGLTNIIDIKSITNNHIALDKNGDVYAWGPGTLGATGNGNIAIVDVPEKIKTLKNIVAISGCNDGYHFLALDDHHNCYTWGIYNLDLTKIYSTPMLIATNVADIMAGETFSYIIKTDGSLWANGQSKTGSIWLNLTNLKREDFTEIDPSIAPLNLCQPLTKCKVFIHDTLTMCPSNTIKIYGQTISDPGNYIDTIESYANCDTFHITNVVFNPIARTFQSLKICKNESITVGLHRYFDEGTYTDTIPNYKNCDSIITTELKLLQNSEVNQAFTFCRNEFVMVGNLKRSKIGIYHDTLKNYLGCDSIVITEIYGPCNFKIFNVFTPNNDGINDVFEILGDQYLSYDIKIYNRWGIVVFEKSNIEIQAVNHFWNGKVMNTGKDCPDGTYYYLIYPKDSSNQLYNGVIELIR